jgi:hypothetical protein
VLLPVIVLLPLAAVAPRLDHRFNIYWHGGQFRDNPLRIVSHTITTAETYLRLGNFRPLGRMLEKSLDLLAFTGVQQLHLPANVTLRLVALGAAILLTLAVVVFTESMLSRGPVFGSAPSTVTLLLPYAVAAGLVAGGPSSTTVLFGGLYFSTAALVLLVAAAACRIERLRWWHAILATTAGATLAIVNEPAYFAVPLATAAVVLRGRYVLGRGARELLGSAGLRATALLWLGFLPVIATVRWTIHGYHTGGDVYDGSDLVVNGHALLVLPARMLAWLPPLQWQAATEKTSGTWLWGILPVASLIALTLLALRTRKMLRTATRPPTAALAGLGLTAGILLAFGALPAALSSQVHQDYLGRSLWEHGWRDSATTAPAGMLLAVTALLLLTRAGPRATGATLAALALCAAGSTAANQAYADLSAAQAQPRLDNRIALEMASFDRGPAGDARRCALLTEALHRSEGRPAIQQRYRTALDVAAHQLAGVPFCRSTR